MQWLRRSFITGFFVTVPLAISIAAFIWIFRVIDGFVGPFYDAWLQRFETAMRALPEQQRQHSLLPILHAYQRPEKPNRGSVWPADRFCSAVQEAKIGPDKDIPHISAPIIVKYITNLQLLGLL